MVRAFYQTGFGLAGCYLDDSQGGAREFNRRKDLAEAIRYELKMYDFPASLMREVNLRRLWSAIVNAKSASSFTFHLHHKQFVLTFYGLTEREYLENRANDEGADEDDREALAAYERGE